MAVENFTAMVRERIETVGITMLRHGLGFEDSGCITCGQDLLVIENSQNILLSKFFMFNFIQTSSQCDLDTLRNQMILFIDKIIVLESDLHIAFQFNGLFKNDIQTIYDNATLIGTTGKPCMCRHQYRLFTDKVCPRLQLDYSKLLSLPPSKATQQLLSLFRNKDNIEEAIAYLEICIQDYFSLLSRVNAGLSIEHEHMFRHVTIMSTLILFFI